MSAPKDVPEPIRALLEREVQQALQIPDVQARFRAQALDPIGNCGRRGSGHAHVGRRTLARRHQDIQDQAGVTRAREAGPKSSAEPAPASQIVMLGTGTPRPDPARSGPATAIVVNGTPYLVDFGPGVIRRAAAAYNKGITALGAAAGGIKTVFLTHMHADHTAGYPDLILTPWILGRKEPIEVYGPKGLRAMTRHVLSAWKIDIDNRVNGIDRLPPAGCQVVVHEIKPGVIYTDRNIRVTAFPVRHGLEHAFGFRFETPDRVIVMSGDTAPTPELARALCRV